MLKDRPIFSVWNAEKKCGFEEVFPKKLHFYHLETSPQCRQEGKSFEHLFIQQHIQNICGNMSSMEVSFPEIQRIGDVAWFPKKLIFEVQCSPISPLEVESRCKDYAKIGWRVIWILHDKRYHKRKVSSAELYLSSQTHYFASILDDQEVIIYDSFDPIKDGRRLQRKKPLFSIDLAHIELGQIK